MRVEVGLFLAYSPSRIQSLLPLTVTDMFNYAVDEGLCRFALQLGYRGMSPAGSEELCDKSGAFAYASCKNN